MKANYLNSVTAIVLLLLAACNARGDISEKQGALSQVKPGMTSQQVVALLGQPGAVYKETKDYEIYSYCSTGFLQDEYYKIHIEKGVVQNIITDPGMYVDGSCGLVYQHTNAFNTKSPSLKCEEYGFKKGTKDYGYCMMEQERMAHSSTEHGRTLNAAAEMQKREQNFELQKQRMAPPPQTSIHCSTFATGGGNSQTSCH